MKKDFDTMKENNSTRVAAYLAVFTMLVLCCGAVMFFKERMLFLDAAFVLFSIINKGHLFIQENRIGSFITQMIPLAGTKMQLPLKGILLSYSLAFNVFYTAMACWLVFIQKQYRLAVLMVLYYVLLVSHAYYWTNNEVYQAIAWMFPALGLLASKHNGRIHPMRLVLFGMLMTIAIFTHAAIIPVCLFLWVYGCLYIWRDYLYKKEMILLSVFLVVLIATKIMLSAGQPYDGYKIHCATHLSLQNVIDGFSSDLSLSFLKRCVTTYYAATILFIWGLVWLLKGKRYLATGIVLASFAGYYFLICRLFSHADDVLFYAESEWMGIAIIAATPFVFHVLPRLKPAIAFLVMAVVFVSCINNIYQAHKPFTNRLTDLQNTLHQMEKKKLHKIVLQSDSNDTKRWMATWALPEESMLLSAMKEKTVRSFFIKDSTTNPAIWDDNRLLSTSYTLYYQKDINHTYFIIDTTTAYTIMTKSQLIQ